jgi:hypothetical protein
MKKLTKTTRNLFLLLSLISIELHSAEELKPLPKKLEIKKIELKKIESIQPFKLNTMKLNIKPINLNADLGKLLEEENQKKKKEPTILRTGHFTGQFEKLVWGDYQHLEIMVDGKKKSLWCWKGCEKLEKLKNKSDVIVLWREVESFIPEAGENVKRIETTNVIVGKKLRSCSIHKKLPQLSKGCEGEACGFLKYNKSTKKVDAYENANVSSKVIGTLNRCDKIEKFETFIVLQNYGLAEVITPNDQLKKMGVSKGDIISVVKSLGEGYLDACVDKNIIDAVDSGTDPYGKQANLKVLQYNKSESWVKLKLPSGKFGFIPEDKGFYMGYYGYSAEYLCPEDHPCGKSFLSTLKKVETTITKSFDKFCKIRKGCTSSDPSLECQLSKDIWGEISSIFPKAIQCAGFGVSRTACGKSWGGSFSCVCPSKEQRDLSYSYSCEKGKGCRMDSPFKL